MASPYPSLRWWLLPFLRSRIWTVRGLGQVPPDGGFILVANHQSWIDSAILAAAVYRRLKKPLKFITQSTKYGAFGGLPIQNDNPGNVIEIALGFLQAGFPVAVFPEGDSNKNPELRTGKTGAARLALRSGLPVVPIGIKGTRGVKAWRAVIWFFSLVYPCHVEIGPTVRFPKIDLTDDQTALLQQTTDAVMSNISDLSGKPMPGEGPVLGRRGVWWFILWRLVRPLMQWRVRIRGGEHVPLDGPLIVAANHTSYFDAPALAMAVFHVIGRQSMFPTKAAVALSFRRLVGRGGLQALGMLPIDTADKSKVLGPAIDHLRRGGVIGVFPEGTRNKPSLNPKWRSELLKGKTGAARMVIATGATVIPAAVTVPRGFGIIESIVKGLLPWKFLRVTFGPAVRFDRAPASLDLATKDDLDWLTRQIMRPIADLAGYSYPY